MVLLLACAGRSQRSTVLLQYLSGITEVPDFQCRDLLNFLLCFLAKLLSVCVCSYESMKIENLH